MCVCVCVYMRACVRACMVYQSIYKLLSYQLNSIFLRCSRSKSLREGAVGSGKTALAAKLALDSGFPLVKLISPERMVGFSEQGRCNEINKVIFFLVAPFFT